MNLNGKLAFRIAAIVNWLVAIGGFVIRRSSHWWPAYLPPTTHFSSAFDGDGNHVRCNVLGNFL